MKLKILTLLTLVTALSVTAIAQRTPAEPKKPYVVKTKQEVSAIEKTLLADNKYEDLTGGPGTQLRVAIQHDKWRENTEAESHDDSDDVYYVLEGSARLTLGGKLDSPREASPGEWRAKTISGGKTIDLKKGDLVVVPRGTPHQRNSIKGKTFSMILIKIFAEPLPGK